ncbi:MAG: hypothetical protein Q8P67_25770 [archaeon]|nr:hypothetical protein [archaeon]
MGSGLSAAQQEELRRVGGLERQTRVEDKFTAQVTHVVTSATAEIPAKRTVKYFQGILAGCWVLGSGWPAACVAEGRLADELAFELRANDRQETADGPRRAREARAGEGFRALFAGHSFCLLASGKSPMPLQDVRRLVALGGGRVVAALPNGRCCADATEAERHFTVLNCGEHPEDHPRHMTVDAFLNRIACYEFGTSL